MAAHAGSLHGVLLLDKPAGYSSTRALARARRLLGAPKAGHTGTLDPFATGLLPLAFGEATKFARFLIDSRKAYEATLRLGWETSTGDPEGEVVAQAPVDVNDRDVDAALRGFEGPQEQLPPMHSALHVNGRRLYEYARAGEQVERLPRRIEIHEIRRTFLRGELLGIAVACSKGTYIRSLAADIGRALGCGASLVGLRRTAAGPFRVEDAVTLDALEANPDWGRRSLLPAQSLVARLPRCTLEDAAARRFAHGQAIALAQAPAPGEAAVFGPGGRFLGVGRADGTGALVPVRLMAPVAEAESPDFA